MGYRTVIAYLRKSLMELSCLEFVLVCPGVSPLAKVARFARNNTIYFFRSMFITTSGALASWTLNKCCSDYGQILVDDVQPIIRQRVQSAHIRLNIPKDYTADVRRVVQ